MMSRRFFFGLFAAAPAAGMALAAVPAVAVGQSCAQVNDSLRAIMAAQQSFAGWREGTPRSERRYGYIDGSSLTVRDWS